MGKLARGHQIGPYRIVRLLGQGGMGAVYEAERELLGLRVALKTLLSEHAEDQEALDRFFREARVLSQLEHPSIVHISDFGFDKSGMVFLAMEYVRGRTLAAELARLQGERERMPWKRALRLGWQIADALSVCHAKGITHRDLKPQNIMLVEDRALPGGERAKLLDFGIAKLALASGEAKALTDTKNLLGTPMYMSPEQCKGAGAVDSQSDVYSLGCVLYEILAGRPPFVADPSESWQYVGMHLFQTPPELRTLAPEVPPAVSALLHRLLLKAKEERPTMVDVTGELSRLLAAASNAPAPPVRSAEPAKASLAPTSEPQREAATRQLTSPRRTGRRLGLMLTAAAAAAVAWQSGWLKARVGPPRSGAPARAPAAPEAARVPSSSPPGAPLHPLRPPGAPDPAKAVSASKAAPALPPVVPNVAATRGRNKVAGSATGSPRKAEPRPVPRPAKQPVDSEPGQGLFVQ